MMASTTCSLDPILDYTVCSTIYIPDSTYETVTPTSVVETTWRYHPQESTKNGGASPETAVIVAGPTTTSTIASSSLDGASQTAAISSVPSSTSHGSDGVSKGAVAGIAIGTFIVGAAIAFFIAFALFKRRKQPLGFSAYEPSRGLVSLSKGGPTPYVQEVSPALPPNGAGLAAANGDVDLTNLSHSSDFLAAALPHTADDRTVREKVSMIFSQIQQHVENFYRDVHANITPSMESDLARFGMEAAGVVEMLQTSSVPTVAIKHALIGYVLSITSPERGEGSTLFPRDVTGVGGREQFTGTSDLSATYILYRRLAVHLHTSVPSNTQTRHSEIREAAEHFALTFFPWANPMYGDQEKDEDLIQIITRALDLNIWLYGQPFVYEFLWESVGRRGTVVAPGLTKVTDAKGRVSERQQILLEPLVMST